VASHDCPISIRQLLPRLLSEELQLYFSRVTIAVESGGATPATRLQQDASLKSVARDRGLQESVPFLCRYIASQIFQHIGDVEHCRTLIRLTRLLLMNPYLHLELQVCSKYDKSEQSMHSSVLTCHSFSCINSCRLSLRAWWPSVSPPNPLTTTGHFGRKPPKYCCMRVIGECR
jgi:hypothetical protein